MAGSVQFIFGIHCHQPVGNFDFIFQEALEKSYRPFLEVAASHPSIALTLHFSGSLLEWLEDNEPTFLDRIADLVQRGNVELLSGGFYEPVLGMIPDRDKVGQIQKLNNYLSDRFGYRPEGIWLTERVWEPHLARPIREAGLSYVTVDDYHFQAAGMADEELRGYFLTEEQNMAVGVFPISHFLRYTIPFREPEETLQYLRQAATEEGDVTIVMIDDGEKFGLWPGTHQRCHGRDRWLDRFFTALVGNSDWVETTTFGSVFHSRPPRGRVYLPTASYFEMSQWSLPAESGEQFADFVEKLTQRGEIDTVRPYVRGGMWRNFLVKYPESNWMQKRMVQVSTKVARRSREGGIDNGWLDQARQELWRSQCNCAYWHGVFGGLYLPHLRHAVFEHLLAAEQLLDGVVSGVRFSDEDVDLDGFPEIEATTPALKAIFKRQGGALCELDYLPARFNLLNTLRRYRESYHRKVAGAGSTVMTSGSIHEIVQSKERNLEDHLAVDNHPRYSLLDHFYDLPTTVEDLLVGRAEERGTFGGQLFEAEISSESVTLTGAGRAFGVAAEIVKQVRIDEDTLEFEVAAGNRGHRPIEGLYCLEFNFSLLGGHSDDRYYLINDDRATRRYLDAADELQDVSTLALITEWERVEARLYFPQPTRVWRYPVQTVSASESGFERIYQSSVILPVYTLKLDPGEHFKAHLSLRISGRSKSGD